MSGNRITYTVYDRDQVAKWKAARAAVARQESRRRGSPKDASCGEFRVGMVRIILSSAQGQEQDGAQ